MERTASPQCWDAVPILGLSGTGFSLWGLNHARTNPQAEACVTRTCPSGQRLFAHRAFGFARRKSCSVLALYMPSGHPAWQCPAGDVSLRAGWTNVNGVTCLEFD
jgi:hypothetical protein